MQTKKLCLLYRGEVGQRVPCQEITRNKADATELKTKNNYGNC